MPIIAKNDQKDYEQIPAGMHQAVCAFVEDIGTHEGSYAGKPIRRHQIVICWELAEKMTRGENAGKPFMISKFYTLSLFEKASLRKDLESWRGRGFTDEELGGFDVENLIGANCFLNIIEETKQDGSKRSKIASINPVAKGMEKLNVINTKPPAWIAEQRAKSIEMITAEGEGTQPEGEDDLPF